jgi:hypothetical protein
MVHREPSARPAVVASLPKLVKMAYRTLGPLGAKMLKEGQRKLRKSGCFVAGMLIAVATGSLPIEKVVVGDRVWTLPGGHETQVNETWRLVSLRMEDAQTGGPLELETVQPPEWLLEHQALRAVRSG